MRKRVIKICAALILSAALSVSMSGCLISQALAFGKVADILEKIDEKSSETETSAAFSLPESRAESTEEQTQGPEESSSSTGESASSSEPESTFPAVGSGEEIPMGEPGTWTIFVYLCGTDLESSDDYEGGAGTLDLQEMLNGSKTPGIRFVIETGGTAYWYNNTVSSERNERFLIENGEIEKLSESQIRNMGDSATLSDFLKFGIRNYPAEKMGIIFWNHGGGSITGVCFDELFDDDSLSLREIGTALSEVSQDMTDRFEWIGFDACLMATVETAGVLSPYARYMIGSEEVELGSGWDYEAIGSFLSDNPTADGPALGKEICESFYRSSVSEGEEASATLSVVDLSKIPEFLTAFDQFSQEIYSAGEDQEKLSQMVRNIRSAENFGGNNRLDGYTNMVDLGGILKACEAQAPSAKKVQSLLSECVIYQVRGSDHAGCSGLSLYYPLEIGGSSELSVFSGVCVSPYYFSFVDRQAYGSVSGGDLEEYDDEEWLSDDDLWTWLFGEWDEDYYGEGSPDYWSELDGESSEDSELITFLEGPQLDDEGSYYFILDDQGMMYAADVTALVYQISPDGEDFLEIGETIDIYADWDSGYFCDLFDGYWISLPDGQNLALYISELTEDYVLYSSPVYLNGEEMNLRLRQYYEDGKVLVEGAYPGMTDYGAAAREIRKIQAGDVLIPRYFSYTLDDMEEGEYVGVEYTVSGEFSPEYGIMDPGDYYYAFCIDDIYGGYLMTDFVEYCVEEDGSVSYYEE